MLRGMAGDGAGVGIAAEGGGRMGEEFERRGGAARRDGEGEGEGGMMGEVGQSKGNGEGAPSRWEW